MLQNEFERLTGILITNVQFEVINAMYMADDNQSKQEFCKCFKEMGLINHVNYVVRLKGERESLNKEKYELECQRDMWRDEYVAVKEKTAAMEYRLKSIAALVKGGVE